MNINFLLLEVKFFNVKIRLIKVSKTYDYNVLRLYKYAVTF